MALTAALKAQIAAWYKALQEQIPDFIPRAPQRQMIADVAKTLAGEEGRHLAIEAPTGVGKTLSYLIPGIAIAREEQKTLVVSTANVALQDQIYSKDLPLLKKIIPDLKFTAAFGRGRYVCPRNLTALASTEPTQQDLLAFLDDELTPNNQEEQKRCAKLKGDLDTYKWDGLRDHTDIAIDDDLWRRLSTDKASCLNRNCYYYRECPFFVARREIQEAEVVVANHALVMAPEKFTAGAGRRSSPAGCGAGCAGDERRNHCALVPAPTGPVHQTGRHLHGAVSPEDHPTAGDP